MTVGEVIREAYERKDLLKLGEVVDFRDPEERRKYNVRAKTFRAVKSGKIEKLPCEVCGDKNSQAHHDDYDKPLEVRWLCPLHHREVHNV